MIQIKMNQHQTPYIWITFFLWIIGSIPSYSNIFHKNNPPSYSYTPVCSARTGGCDASSLPHGKYPRRARHLLADRPARTCPHGQVYALWSRRTSSEGTGGCHQLGACGEGTRAAGRPMPLWRTSADGAHWACRSRRE